MVREMIPRQSWAAREVKLQPMKVSSSSTAPALPSQELVGAPREDSRERFEGVCVRFLPLGRVSLGSSVGEICNPSLAA